jgi:prephenate dehydrogenase
MIDRLAIIGVGLIGSSLALALKQAGAVGQVVGYGRNRHNLEKGVELGVIDRFEATIAESVADADVIVVAVPLGAMQQVFAELKSSIRADAVITDVGSAKASVIAAAKATKRRRSWFCQLVPEPSRYSDTTQADRCRRHRGSRQNVATLRCHNGVSQRRTS